MRDEIAVERHLRHGGEVFLGTHDRLKIGGLGFLINPGVAVDVDHLLTLQKKAKNPRTMYKKVAMRKTSEKEDRGMLAEMGSYELATEKFPP
ncbi:hypothetical protein RB195_012401 [Necator americanus]|uniref:Uncharacterized protein n=1 Tax=Necator americanus TaxID=51031 RepID=A0ABR1D6Y7_NECAM